MTALPTIVYPTLTPTLTLEPSEEPSKVVCGNKPVSIVCKATVCIVRKNPAGGEENRAYNVPSLTVIEDVVVCECPSCPEFEQEWFYLGESGDQYYWALSMKDVWEQVDQGE